MRYSLLVAPNCLPRGGAERILTPGDHRYAEYFPALVSSDSSAASLIRQGSFSDGNGSGTGWAPASYGNMGAYAAVTANPGDASIGTSVTAAFRDTWTVSGTGWVTLLVPVTLEGSYAWNGSANEGMWIGVEFPGGSPDQTVGFGCRIDTGCTSTPTGFFSASGYRSITLYAGVPTDVEFTLARRHRCRIGRITVYECVEHRHHRRTNVARADPHRRDHRQLHSDHPIGP